MLDMIIAFRKTKSQLFYC